jgi:hypothetical protein
MAAVWRMTRTRVGATTLECLAVAAVTAAAVYAVCVAAGLALSVSVVLSVLAAVSVFGWVFVWVLVLAVGRLEFERDVARRDLRVIGQRRAVQRTMRDIASHAHAALKRRDEAVAQEQLGYLMRWATETMGAYPGYNAAIRELRDAAFGDDSATALERLDKLYHLVHLKVYAGYYML